MINPYFFPYSYKNVFLPLKYPKPKSKLFSGMVENRYGDKAWYVDGQLSSLYDFPAVEMSYGAKYWFRNGFCHRENAPAVEFMNKRVEWWNNGLLTRKDGPTYSLLDSNIHWRIIQEEKEVNDIPKNYTGILRAFIDESEHIQYRLNGKLHRITEPALEYKTKFISFKEWIVNGKYHRIGGPTVEYFGGSKFWYKHSVESKSCQIDLK